MGVKLQEAETPRWRHTHAPLVASDPRPNCTVCVIVPARDEASSLPAALEALRGQVEIDGRPIGHDRYEIIVLANNCRDDTAAAARAMSRSCPGLRLHVVERTLPDGEANIGAVRRLLMDEAGHRLLSRGHGRGVIASTDADTIVSPTWLAATLAEITGGADAVGGRIIVASLDDDHLEAETRRYHLWDVTYHHLIAELESLLDPDPADPWPRHHQHFGASLAVTAALYRHAGGVPPVDVLEDMALYQALRRVDARIRHSPRVRVVTSARRAGRVTRGLSTQLEAWDTLVQAGRLPLVESAAAAERRVRTRRALRELWRRGTWESSSAIDTLQRIADRLNVDRWWLTAEALRSRPFGVFYENVLANSGAYATTEPLTEITGAILSLRRRLPVLRQRGPIPKFRASGSASHKHVKPIPFLPPAAEVV